MESREENVKVVVRCRPLLETESSQDPQFKIHSSNNSVEAAGRQYTFDRVFGFESSQESLYEEAGRGIVDSVLEGYNGTIFAYGQTGTGKTFTQSGVLDQSFRHVFDFISSSKKDTQFLVRASYYEIYNEEIRDLLSIRNKKKDSASSSASKSLELKESGTNSVYIKNLSCYVVNNVNELLKLKNLGEKSRSVASTNMNLRSSRSHTVFTITIEMIKQIPNKAKGALRVGKINLVDLAGSERQSKTGTTGDRLKEAAKINLSLTSLSLVISALTDPKATHVPYRNSKLTRILSDSLGGNSKTLLIACIGPCKTNLEETLSTLRFASTAKRIKNKAVINEDAKDTLLRKFQDQILQLRKQLEEEADDNDEDAGDEDDTDEAGKMRQRIRRGSNPVMTREMQEKLKMLEQKIMFGGENLLEKAERQEQELKQREQELLASKEKELQLESVLQQKESEILKIEESYGSLQEEVTALNKKLKKVFNYLLEAKEELSDCQGEFSQVRQDLLDSIRETDKEVKLADLIIQECVPGKEGFCVFIILRTQ